MDALFEPVVAAVKNAENYRLLKAAIEWVEAEFPELAHKVAWKQAMFVDHGTFIIGLSTSADNLLVAPEAAAIAHFAERLDAAGINRSDQMFRLPWDSPLDTALLADVIRFNVADKAGLTSFWRPRH